MAENEKTREQFDFNELIARETRRLDEATGRPPAQKSSPIIASSGVADEPWVSFTDRELFGLALSGGGIRSATFNLGLLQALERKNLLKEVDYVSTVSGGGYIGGFWTAWRYQADGSQGNFPLYSPAGKTAPTASTNVNQPPRRGPSDKREPAPIRHLREFSRFLMPRLGFFHSETWDGIVAILGGMLPAISAAAALLTLVHYGWFVMTVGLMVITPWMSALNVALITLGFQFLAEKNWRRLGRVGESAQAKFLHFILMLGGSALAGILWLAWRTWDVFQGLQAEWESTFIYTSREELTHWSDPPGVSVAPFALALVWIMVGVVLLFVRFINARFSGRKSAVARAGPIDRTTSRLLGPAVVWVGFALVWELSRYVLSQKYQTSVGAVTGISATTTGLLFVWLRNWLGKPVQETNASTLLAKIFAKLKPLAPQLLANLTVLLLFFGVGLLVQNLGLGPWYLRILMICALVLLLTLLLFNPARIGLHDFYRSRICRCYLGAADAKEWPAYRRPTTEQPDDDLTLGQLRDHSQQKRPIHLVCATANNQSGDVLGSLYRGGRSAVLSPFGLSMGNYTAAMDDLRLSSALTASAAAFNSQMGRLSIDLGPAVSFLMCAFNLRLGLWVPHPLNPSRKPLAEGVPYFFEMFGRTNCDPLPEPEKISKTPSFVPQQVTEAQLAFKKRIAGVKNQVHLSDGGHFENLALYELIRRHTRYIIASDCGADRTVAFDDLANVQRCVREDFGVEIEIDVTPLRPDENGRAAQHAVVGTIHYDGYAGIDKGTLLYFKPALTGDEAPDVLQYQVRNPSFPHETTGDQFYDAAQWETYRRLGDHAGNVIFRFLRDAPKPDGSQLNAALRRNASSTKFLENAFLRVGQRWHPAPRQKAEIFDALNQRCADLEAAVRDETSSTLRLEYFPEIAEVLGAGKTAEKTVASRETKTAPSTDDEARTVFLLMQVAQLIEDTWVSADLETNWSNPIFEGWMNYFHRWASTPSFRRWWPILRPLYSDGMRDFVRDRFDIIIKDPVSRQEPPMPGALLQLEPLTNSQNLTGFARAQWENRLETFEARRRIEGKEALTYHLTLLSTEKINHPFQAGFLLYRFNPAKDGISYVEWQSQDLFVPPSLVGAGIVARLLDAAINYFTKDCPAEKRPHEIRVLLEEASTPPSGEKSRVQPARDPGARLQRVHNISFYKSRGFNYVSPAETNGALSMLKLTLREPESRP